MSNSAQLGAPLDLHAINTALLSVCLCWAVIVYADRWQHSNFTREPITPPPDPGANIARDRELERQSRMTLLGVGCPPLLPARRRISLAECPRGI